MTPSVVGEKAEGPYVTAKTSVWWDIENCHVPKRFDAHSIAQNISSALVSLNYCGPVSISAYGDSNRIPPAVQQALNSTGISLNHVPAGVKDASDKKILVDMLFWAVDNPAPANYLLISGDRDFSNALHQLRMRRYNILLGQPKQTSAALIAAAKIVWSWNSLISGGPPLSSGDIPEFVDDANSKFNPAIVQGLVQNNTPKIHPVNLKPEDGDASKPKIVLNSPKQPTTRTQSIPVWIQKNKVPPESALAKQFNIAPHEFFRASDANPASSSAENIYPNDSDQSKNQDKLNSIQCLQPRAIFSPHNFYAPDSSNNGFRPMVQKPDTSQFSWTPSVSENNNYTWKPKISDEKLGSNVKPKSLETPDLAMPYLPTHGAGDLHTRQPISFPMLNYTNSKVFEVPTMSTSSKNNSTGDIHGVQTCKLPSESIQGLIWIILAALDTLKKDKLIPTEANIKDCIRYGDPKFQNTDVDKALSLALEQQMISMKRVGSVELYLGKNERLWNCVNPIGGGNPNIYSKATWDGIQKFLSSSAGSSAIMSSKCRYEAASILKNACLKEYVLGEVLQILNMIATIKQWITHSKSGWQPVSVTIAES